MWCWAGAGIEGGVPLPKHPMKTASARTPPPYPAPISAPAVSVVGRDLVKVEVHV